MSDMRKTGSIAFTLKVAACTIPFHVLPVALGISAVVDWMAPRPIDILALDRMAVQRVAARGAPEYAVGRPALDL